MTLHFTIKHPTKVCYPHRLNYHANKIIWNFKVKTYSNMLPGKKQRQFILQVISVAIYWLRGKTTDYHFHFSPVAASERKYLLISPTWLQETQQAGYPERNELTGKWSAPQGFYSLTVPQPAEGMIHIYQHSHIFSFFLINDLHFSL